MNKKETNSKYSKNQVYKSIVRNDWQYEDYKKVKQNPHQHSLQIGLETLSNIGILLIMLWMLITLLKEISFVSIISSLFR
jgi:hypothetical protein